MAESAPNPNIPNQAASTSAASGTKPADETPPQLRVPHKPAPYVEDDQRHHQRRRRRLGGRSNTPALHIGNPRRYVVDAGDGTPLVVHHWPGGTGPTLVLCDGLGCDGYTWPYVLRRYVAERPVFHMQWRGHGDSGVPDDIDTVRLRTVVDDLSNGLKLFGITDAILLGHSMGVPIALEAWRANLEGRFAADIKALGLFCGVFEDPISSWHGPFASYAPRPLGNVLMNALFDTATGAVLDHWDRLADYWRRLLRTEAAYTGTVAGELNPAYIREEDFRPYLKHLERMDMRVFARLARDMREHSARDVLPTITVPTLIVGGARDKFAPRHIAETMHREIRGSTMLMMVEGSHAAPIEQPRLVERALSKLLRRVAPLPDAPPPLRTAATATATTTTTTTTTAPESGDTP